MGFFSDLKNDLSQTVNELQADPTQEASDVMMDTEIPSEETADLTGEDLSSLLDQLESETASAVATATEEFTAPVEAEPTYAEPVYEAPVYEAPVAPTPTSAPASSGNRIATDEVSVIMESMIINGNMQTDGSLELRGAVVGNVECLGKLNITGSIQGNSTAAEIFADNAKIAGEVRSMGAIKIGQSTTIIGNVFATSAVVAGAVKGDIDVRGPVVLDSTAIVLGNIKSKAVQINNGAVVEGMCSQCYAEVNPKSFFEELKKMS